MATVNTQFSFGQLESIYSQLDSLAGGQIGQNVPYLNSVFGAIGDIEQIASGDAQQQANGIQSLVNRLMKVIEKLGAQESTRARKEVADTAKKAEDLNARSQKLGVEMEGKLSDVSDSISEQTEIVTEANQQLTEAQQAIKEKQEEIQEIVDQIIEAQEKLKAEKDPAKQAEILGEIQGLTAQIASIGVTIADDQKVVDNLTSAVENAVEDIENATDKMTVIEQDGQAQISQLTQDASDATGEIIDTASEGTQNATNAAEAQALASGASSNIFTGTTVAPQLQRVVTDQSSASNARLSSIAGNVNRVAQGIGSLQNGTQIINTFKNTIGSALDAFTGQITSWDSVLQPVITSIGSFGTVTKGVEELADAVETDLDTIGYDIKDNGKIKKSKDSKAEKAEEPENRDENIELEVELLTPEVDATKIVRNFGI